MPSNSYHFITTWRVSGTPEELNDILEDPTDLPRWSPYAYLDVRELEHGGEQGLGKFVSQHARGWLPYTLRWQFRVTESRYPHGFTLQADGDSVGRGIWTSEQSDSWVTTTHDWLIDADKPLSKYLIYGALRRVSRAREARE